MHCLLMAGLEPAPRSRELLNPAGPELYVGCRVVVHGMVQRPEFNGREGTCRAYIDDKARWKAAAMGCWADLTPPLLVGGTAAGGGAKRGAGEGGGQKGQRG
jgi:hypothetical protein